MSVVVYMHMDISLYTQMSSANCHKNPISTAQDVFMYLFSHVNAYICVYVYVCDSSVIVSITSISTAQDVLMCTFSHMNAYICVCIYI